jgi:hypothetical protein
MVITDPRYMEILSCLNQQLRIYKNMNTLNITHFNRAVVSRTLEEQLSVVADCKAQAEEMHREFCKVNIDFTRIFEFLSQLEFTVRNYRAEKNSLDMM